jgi:haloacetate dehalogenase
MGAIGADHGCGIERDMLGVGAAFQVAAPRMVDQDAAHRLSRDRKEMGVVHHVTRVAVLDIVPLPYSDVTLQFATEYFHWFFLIQPAPFPETLLGNNAEFFLRSRFLRSAGATGAFTPEAFAEYLRCFRNPETIHATCEDYRAGSISSTPPPTATARSPARCWCSGASAARSAGCTT